MKSNFIICFFLSVSIVVFSGCDKPREEDKTVSNLKVDTTAAEIISHILFVGKWYDKVGIYKYDLIKQKHETVWWHPRENVTLLVAKPVYKPSFFFTTKKMGVKGNFPFFEKIKIYRISSDLTNTEFIYEIKDGMQITADWDEDGNLEVVFSAMDKTDPTFINRHIKTFDNYGKLINDEIEIFNLVSDGFPELLPKRNPTVSLSGKYGISFLGDSVFLKTAESDSLILITTIKHSLNKINWSKDDEFIFISTLDLKNETVKTRKPETAELYVYSISQDSVIAFWKGAGVKNFYTFDSLIVFDEGFGRNSSINIYNFVKEELIDKFQMKGECGLFYIPKL
jgi:hypothetical protein